MLKVIPVTTPEAADMQEDRQNRRRFELARLLRSTEEIMHCAQVGDWESVETLEKQRQLELAACFAGEGEESSPLVAEALATLLHMNNQIADLVRKAKNDLVEEQQRMESQRSVADQYQNNL